MNGYKLLALAPGTLDTDAVNKAQLDQKVGNTQIKTNSSGNIDWKTVGTAVGISSVISGIFSIISAAVSIFGGIGTAASGFVTAISSAAVSVGGTVASGVA
jgi:hypothetical protein